MSYLIIKVSVSGTGQHRGHQCQLHRPQGTGAARRRPGHGVWNASSGLRAAGQGPTGSESGTSQTASRRVKRGAGRGVDRAGPAGRWDLEKGNRLELEEP